MSESNQFKQSRKRKFLMDHHTSSSSSDPTTSSAAATAQHHQHHHHHQEQQHYQHEDTDEASTPLSSSSGGDGGMGIPFNVFDVESHLLAEEVEEEDAAVDTAISSTAAKMDEDLEEEEDRRTASSKREFVDVLSEQPPPSGDESCGEVDSENNVISHANNAAGGGGMGSEECCNASKVSLISWGRGDLNGIFRPESGSSVFDGFSDNLFMKKRNIVQIASNAYHSAAVSTNGDLFTCGSNEDGQVYPFKNEEENVYVDSYAKPKLFDNLGNHRVCSVSCGLYHTVCVTATGVAVSFGGNEVGQLGHSSKQVSKVVPRVVEFQGGKSKTSIVQNVACGDLFSLFLTTSSELYSCGMGEYCGHPNADNLSQAKRIDALVSVPITAIACGSNHSLALASTGELYAWGSSQYGQLGLGDSIKSMQCPTEVKVKLRKGDKIVGIAAGAGHSIIWTQMGDVFGTGSNKQGQLALVVPQCAEFQNIPMPTTSRGGGRLCCKQAICGSNHTLAIFERTSTSSSSSNSAGGGGMLGDYNEADSQIANEVFGWGSNNFNQITGASTFSRYMQPFSIQTPYDSFGVRRAVSVFAGGDHSFLLALKHSVDDDDTLFKKQFSTQASRAIVATDSKRLLAQLNNVTSTNTSTKLPLVLTSICQLFSSPSLLSGCFTKQEGPAQLDIESIEACYKTILELGSAAVVRITTAILECINELSVSNIISFTSVRVILILWQAPIFGNAMLSCDVFKKLIPLVRKLPESLKIELLSDLMTYPSHILAARILKPLQEHLSYHVDSSELTTSMAGSIGFEKSRAGTIAMICEILGWIYKKNLKAQVLSKEQFYNEALSNLPDEFLYKDYEARNTYKQSNAKNSNGHPFFITAFGYLLNLHAKRRMLVISSKTEQTVAVQNAQAVGLQMGARFFMPYLWLQVDRENLLHSTLAAVMSSSDADLRKPLRVTFNGEEGIDEGGVRKEFFQLLITKLISPTYGMFQASADGRHIWINQSRNWELADFTLVGILLALALHNGVILDLHFPQVFYKKLLNKPLTFDDLKLFDDKLSSGLNQLLAYEPASDVEDIFCRNFEVDWEEFGVQKSHELVPNGKNIPLTGENRYDYVEAMVKWHLSDSVGPQFSHLLDGFNRVMKSTSLFLQLLEPQELERLMAGLPHLDFNDLQSSTQYIGETSASVSASGGGGGVPIAWSAESPVIRWFWEVIHAMAFEDKQKFLLFVSGSAKAPIGGLKELNLKIQRMCGDSNSLPTSHTCFNVLLLPEYSSKEKLKDRLYKAISECEGFGLK